MFRLEKKNNEGRKDRRCFFSISFFKTKRGKRDSSGHLSSSSLRQPTSFRRGWTSGLIITAHRHRKIVSYIPMSVRSECSKQVIKRNNEKKKKKKKTVASSVLLKCLRIFHCVPYLMPTRTNAESHAITGFSHKRRIGHYKNAPLLLLL